MHRCVQSSSRAFYTTQKDLVFAATVTAAVTAAVAAAVAAATALAVIRVRGALLADVAALLFARVNKPDGFADTRVLEYASVLIVDAGVSGLPGGVAVNVVPLVGGRPPLEAVVLVAPETNPTGDLVLLRRLESVTDKVVGGLVPNVSEEAT